MPVYRQIIDQVLGGIAAGALTAGYQLPTVRQVAVDLSINPNTVVRAYRELEIRGVLETQQGTGTFISHQKVKRTRWNASGNWLNWWASLSRAPARPASPIEELAGTVTGAAEWREKKEINYETGSKSDAVEQWWEFRCW